MKDTKAKSGKSIMVRDSSGRFVKGNQEGRKFQKGAQGKPKGARNKKTLVARQFAEDVLYLNPETGKRMSYHELCRYVKKKADTSPRILNLLLDHCIGKPIKRVQHMEAPTFIIQPPPKDDTEEADKAEVIDGEKFSLPEGD